MKNLIKSNYFLLFLFLFSACQNTSQTSLTLPSKPVKDQPNTLHIGLFLPLSAKKPAQRNIAQNLQDAAQLALQDIGNQKIILHIYDTQALPEIAFQKCQQALKDHVKIFIGPVYQETTQAMQEFTSHHHIPLISFSNDDTLANHTTYIFGHTPAQQIDRLIDYMAPLHKNVAILEPAHLYGKTCVNYFKRQALNAGIHVTQTYHYPEKDDAYLYNILSSMVKNNQSFKEGNLNTSFSALFIPDYPPMAQKIARMLDHLKVGVKDLQLFGLSSWKNAFDPSLPLIRNALYCSPENQTYNNFSEYFFKTYQYQPHFIAGLAYDVISLIDQFTYTHQNFTSYLLADNGFTGLYGHFKFLSTGKVKRLLPIFGFDATGAQKIIQQNTHNFITIDKINERF